MASDLHIKLSETVSLGLHRFYRQLKTSLMEKVVLIERATLRLRKPCRRAALLSNSLRHLTETDLAFHSYHLWTLTLLTLPLVHQQVLGGRRSLRLQSEAVRDIQILVQALWISLRDLLPLHRILLVEEVLWLDKGH